MEKIMLFNGTSMDGWHGLNGEKLDWPVENGIMTVATATQSQM